MATRKGGLGKGLDSLIADKVGTSNEKTDAKNEVMVNINKVEPNKEQPRKNFDEDALFELSESIKQYGLLQPILVQDRKDYYEIIAGERRWRASKKAGLTEMPCIIRESEEKENKEIAFKVTEELHKYLKNRVINENIGIMLYKGMPAPVDKIKNKYRFRIIIKCKFGNDTISLINDMINEYSKTKEGKNGSARLSIDLNPNNWL